MKIGTVTKCALEIELSAPMAEFDETAAEINAFVAATNHRGPCDDFDENTLDLTSEFASNLAMMCDDFADLISQYPCVDELLADVMFVGTADGINFWTLRVWADLDN